MFILGTGETIWWIKPSVCKCVDLSSNPVKPHFEWALWPVSKHSNMGAKTGGFPEQVG